MINTEKIRKDFPILSEKVNGNDLIYLDNAARMLIYTLERAPQLPS